MEKNENLANNGKKNQKLLDDSLTLIHKSYIYLKLQMIQMKTGKFLKENIPIYAHI